MTVAQRTSSRVRPRPRSFEFYAWVYTRVSAVLLLFLALTHLVLMHLINNVDLISYSFVAARWALPGWRAFDVALLLLALTHGLNGLRVVADDYVHSRRWRIFAYVLLGVFAVTFLVGGAIVVFTFKPVTPGT
jgi:succinate dehydrogenase / fumarate reductase membrane anchor subunit